MSTCPACGRGTPGNKTDNSLHLPAPYIQEKANTQMMTNYKI